MSVKPRVLFVLKYRTIDIKDHQGVATQFWNDTERRQHLHSGLYNSANFVCEMLQNNGVEAKLVHVLDSNYIHKELVEFKADVGIVEAFWVTPEKFHELHRVMPKVKFIIRNHSDLPFLANEGISMDWSIRYFDVPNLYLSCNSPRMLEQTQFLYSHLHNSKTLIDRLIPYLSNYYPLPEVRPPTRPLQNDDIIRVGCFGAIRPLKNHLSQALAALMLAEKLGRKLHFHTNGGRIEMGGSPIAKNLRQLFTHMESKGHKLIEEPWYTHTEFIEVVRQMDIVMQCSFSETFNIVLADAVSVGTKVLGSREIPWLYYRLQADPTSTDDMVKMMLQLFGDEQKIEYLQDQVFRGLQDYSKKSKQIWLNYFQ